MTGEWSGFRSLTNDDTQAFNAAMGGFAGVDYTPCMVATQVVNGMNYCFLCKAKVVSADGVEFAARK